MPISGGVDARLVSPERAAACSCVSFTDVEAFAAADVIFTGTLDEIITPTGDTSASNDPERFVFDVAEVFKGEAFERQSVVTARDGASCGLEISGRGPFGVASTPVPGPSPVGGSDEQPAPTAVVLLAGLVLLGGAGLAFAVRRRASSA